MDARATGTILDVIVSDRRIRLAQDRNARPESRLRDLVAMAPPAVDFAARLREGRRATPAGARLRLIGEVKRASPSKGVFDAGLDAPKQALAYAAAGAAAISVLTEPDHFKGSLADLEAVRAAFGDDPDRPAVLRKEFIFDPYQVIEARAAGADALLLIVMMLEPPALVSLLAQTYALGMQALVEVHDEAEMHAALAAGATVLGVNNRDLRTFKEDLGTTERVASLVPSNVTLVAESAIRTAAAARRMAACGAHALLVGEALVTTGDITGKARELMLVDDSEVRA